MEAVDARDDASARAGYPSVRAGGASVRAGEDTAGVGGERPGRRAADQPGAVLPGRPVAPGPVVREFTDEAGQDDVVCAVCGTTNRRGQRFCRRCGNPLGQPRQETARLPWWRRLRPPRVRLGLFQLLWRLLVLLLALAVLATVGFLAVRYGPAAVDAVRDRLGKPEATAPTTITASSEAPGHPARAAVDGLSNHYWAPALPGQGDGQYLEMTFERPIRLLDVIVHSGVSQQQELFVTQARPAVLDMTAWTQDGTATTTTLRLADQPGEQRFHHAIGSVTRLRFTIRSSYGTAADRYSAIGEIELFRRP